MALAKDRADWDKWAALLALTRNCHVAERKHLVKPDDMNPYTVRPKQPADFSAQVEAVHLALKRREEESKCR